MNRILLLSLPALFFIVEGFSQNKCWIIFKDKVEGDFNPYQYFDNKAIERRLAHNLPLSHYTDWPVNENYISQVKENVSEIKSVLRWMNAVVALATEEQITELRKKQFISDIIISGQYITPQICITDVNDSLTDTDKDILKKQTERMGAEEFRKNNINGKGVRIAVLDAGFPMVDVHPAFSHLHRDNRIIKTYDFIKKRENVYGSNSHGTMVLSCIAGIFEGKEMGLATGAEFLLARTEKANSEPFSEEEYWMEAMEWADKNGAHIISSSLAYTYHRYFPNEMNGKNSFVAKAAKIAASKGILVVNAAGNDGTADWKIIATPADVDSVLTVGGISPYSDYHISFSSYGPTADKRMKPNVCAFGQVVAASGKDKLKQAYGTSFATPLVAGFAACALQASEYKLKNMELFSEIEKSAHLYPYFDYAHGYGVPQASHFLKLPKNNLATFVIKKESYSIKINILPDFLPAKKDTFDTTDDAVVFDDENSKNYLYYHIQNKEGWIDYYCVIEVKQADVADIDIEKLVSGQKIMINYKGYTEIFTKE